MHAIGNDLRLTARQWGKSPGFCGLAVVILALGLGANLTVFGFVNALLLRPANLPGAGELMRIYASSDGSRYSRTSYPNYRDLAEASESFAGIAAHSEADVSFIRGGDAESLRAEVVTGNFFEVLGLQAARGRLIAPRDDESPGSSPVAVVSHRLSTRRFGLKETIVGEKIFLNGHPFTVIGVAPEGFQGSYEALRTDVWAPLTMYEQVRPRGIPVDTRGWGWLNMTGRLERGVDPVRASEEAKAIAGRLAEDHPRVNQGLAFTLVPASPLPEQFREGATELFTLLTAVVALVLLVACTNVASVLLSRATSRNREMAIRRSLGATRGRILQLSLVESLSLALVAGIAGIAVASWTRNALLSVSSELDSFANFAPRVSTDAATLGFALVLATLTGFALGLAPGLRSSERSVMATLREGGSAGSGVMHHRWQSGFVGVQVALAVSILIVAGLLVRSVREAEAFDPGFRADGLLLAHAALQRHGYGEPAVGSLSA